MDSLTGSRSKTFQTILIFIFITVSQTQATSHKLSCNSTSHKLLPGSTLKCQCHVDISRSGSSGAQWNRVYGRIRQTIGKNHLTEFKFQNNRYSLSLYKSEPLFVVYELEVKDVRLYDGGTIECVSPISKKTTPLNSYSIAVCETPASSFCACMLQKGWATPHCHNEKMESDKHSESLMRACVVIGLLMALMLVVALLVTLRMLNRDVRRWVEAKRDEEMRLRQMEEEQTANVPTPSHSILKKSNADASNSSGTNQPPPTTNQQTTSQMLPKDLSFSSANSNIDYNNHVSFEAIPTASTPPPEYQHTRAPNYNLTNHSNPASNSTSHLNYDALFNSNADSNVDLASFNNYIHNSTNPSQSSITFSQNKDVGIKNSKNPNSSGKKKRKKNTKSEMAGRSGYNQEVNGATEI